MQAGKLLRGSDVGLLCLFTIGFVIAMAFFMIGFYRKNGAEVARNAK